MSPIPNPASLKANGIPAQTTRPRHHTLISPMQHSLYSLRGLSNSTVRKTYLLKLGLMWIDFVLCTNKLRAVRESIGVQFHNDHPSMLIFLSEHQQMQDTGD